jgi:hypothetical protein
MFNRSLGAAHGAGILLATLALPLMTTGCEREGCLSGESGCVVPSPCQQLSFTCEDRSLDVFVISSPADIPGGPDSRGAVGDVVLQNSQVTAVIEALDNPNFFGETGGALTDLVVRGLDNDQLTYTIQTVGLLPDDQAVYTSFEILPEEAGVRAVMLRGHLAGNEGHRLYTRYEIRPCEPGIRVRTELVNNGEEDVVWALTDGLYWSRRSIDPFTPLPGTGFSHPSFGLGNVNDVIRPAPYVGAASYVEPAVGYSVTGCNVEELEGLQSGFVSLVGLPRRLVPPREYEVFERFIGVSDRTGAAGVSDVALEVRRQLFDEPLIRVNGTLEVRNGTGDVSDIRRAEIHIYEGGRDDPVALRTPWTSIVPDADGAFSALVPADRRYTAEVHAFGKVAARREFSVGENNVNIDVLTVDAVSHLTLNTTLDGAPIEAQVFFYPSDDATLLATEALWRGYALDNKVCAPLLGAPYGGSPACNRVLVQGSTTLEVPAGTYDIFATRGPFATLSRTRVELNPGGTSEVTLGLTSLELLTPGTAVSADFHVHGQMSFDTNVPDHTRVLSFLAAGVDVIAATDHEAIWNYAQAMDDLPTLNRMELLVGLETTGHALFQLRPDVTYPQVVGHYNFWPLDFDNGRPRNGAAYAERAEPGLIFTRMRASGLTTDGVIQLNHPWTEGSFGRDFGFPFALGLDLRSPLPLFDDGTPAGVFVRRPEGAELHNHDHDTQEVMNGTDNSAFFGYRAFWFYLLNQGIIRAATANSDSHSMSDNVVGTPRTIVFTPTQVGDAFDPVLFNRDVKAGHMIGTNGPIIRASILGSDNIVHGPSITPFPAEDEAELNVSVRAAPWVPIEEIRVYVNGRKAAFVRNGIVDPVDPLGTEDTIRFEGQFRLGDLLPPDGADAWIVVEAGAILPVVGDIDCNGVPDTSDNNGDGVADWMDVDRNGDGVVDDADLDRNGDGVVAPGEEFERCESDLVGPLNAPPRPDLGDDAFNFWAVTPGGYPLAFTNPLLVDRDGREGFDPPGVDLDVGLGE